MCGRIPLLTKSAKTLPGPTEGSWSESPTIINFIPLGMAANNLAVNSISSIEASSMIKSPPEIGFSLSNSGSPKSVIPSKRWIVVASCPVTSVIRLAARPVGEAILTAYNFKKSWALSANLAWCCSIFCHVATIDLTIVVLPVPGPPVNKNTCALSPALTAAICVSSNINWPGVSNPESTSAAVRSIGADAWTKRVKCCATWFSAT